MTKRSDLIIEHGVLVDYFGKKGDVTIPDSVTGIGGGAFYQCTRLTGIALPGNVTSIGMWAFSGCSSLTSIIIPNSVTSIGSAAFRGCTKLTSKKGYYKAFIPTDDPNIIKAEMKNARYEIGKKKFCHGELKCCKNGIHLCTNIFDIFNYYFGEYGKDFVIALCDASDEHVEHDADSKIACRWVVPKRVLSVQEVIDIMNGKDIDE